MPKTTSFNPQYGYTRHQDDKDGICFWCGAPTHHTWDYTPHRKIAMHAEVLARCPEKPVAVSSCLACTKRMNPHYMKLLTVSHKRAYWARVRKTVQVVDDMVQVVVQNGMYPWQIKLENGDIVDQQDDELTVSELVAKRAFYGIPNDPTHVEILKRVQHEESVSEPVPKNNPVNDSTKPFDPYKDHADF